MKAKKYFYAASVVFLLIACDKNGSSGLAVKTGGYDPNSVTKQVNQQQGLPGSNNQENSDVTTAPEYQKYIAPLGQKIMSFNEFSLPDENAPTADKPSRMTDFFLLIAKMKKWQLTDLRNLDNPGNHGGGRIGIVPANLKPGQQTQNLVQNQNQNPTPIASQKQQIRPNTNFLYQDNLLRITADTIYLDKNYYKDSNNSDQDRAGLILRAIVAQMYLNQHVKASDLLNQMANIDSQMRSDLAISKAAKADKADQLNPAYSDAGLSLSSDEQQRGVSAFTAYLTKYLENPTAMTADELFDNVKSDFIRGANFARPYNDTRAGTVTSTTPTTSTTTTTGASAKPDTTTVDSAVNDK